MKKSDKFGRIWKFKPGHNPDTMLKLSNDVAAIGYNANLAFFHCAYRDAYSEYLEQYGELEPYLLKQPGGWVMGMRYGDEGSQYLSPGIDQRIIAMMIESHRFSCGVKEFAAICELIPERDSDLNVIPDPDDAPDEDGKPGSDISWLS